MVTRLVLGCGAVGFDLLDAMPRREGLVVVTADESRAETLRDSDVDARVGDPADTDAYPPTADVVVVAGADPAENLRTLRRAAEFYPRALLVAYAGSDATAPVLEGLERLADRVVDPVVAVADRVLDAASGPASERTRRLRRVLSTTEEPLAVVTHDNPDPDAIASALALTCIAEHVGLEAEACYFGEISHQENRAFVNLLDLPLVHLSAGDIERYGGVALVDHSRPGVNDSLPSDTAVDVVVDHHPPRGPVEGRFVDLRSDVGATSTLLAGYLKRFDVPPGEQVATALLYGIQVDTREFTREVARADFEAAAYLSEWVDEDVLKRAESPSVMPDTMEVLARAVEYRTVTDGALSTCVGEIRDRDALAQAADRLLNMEGVNCSLVYGFKNGTVYVSGRTRGAGIDLGETLREAFDRIGSAGGHADMAGAQIPMGILADVGGGSRATLTEVIRSVIDERFFGVLMDAPAAPTADNGLTLEYDDLTEGPFFDRPGGGPSSTSSPEPDESEGETAESAESDGERSGTDEDRDAGGDDVDTGDSRTADGDSRTGDGDGENVEADGSGTEGADSPDPDEESGR